MAHFLRLLRVVVAGLFRPRLRYLDESVLQFVVGPGDLDINVHMNNARYLAIMDLGRWDLILRSGLWRPVLKDKLQPVVGGSLIRFRRQLKPFQRFSLRTQVIGWDDRWIYIRHLIEGDGKIACSTIVRATFLRQGRAISPGELADVAGYAGQTLPPPPWLEGWRATDAAFEKSLAPQENNLNKHSSTNLQTPSNQGLAN